jgi:hypothetical protein
MRYGALVAAALVAALAVGAVALVPDPTPQGRYLAVEPVENDGTVETPGEDAERVAFASLSGAQQRAFERALADDDRFVRIPDGVDHAVWIENDVVVYRNRSYRVSVATP